MGQAKRIRISYISCALLTYVVLEVLLYCPNLRFNDDGIEPPVMEDVVLALVSVSIVPHEPSVVVPEPPLVVLELIFDFAEETMGEHDDIAQSLGSMGVCEETEESIDDRIQVILSMHLTHHSVFG